MPIHPIIKLSPKEARMYAEVCDMYCDKDDHPSLAVKDDGDLFMQCKAGVFTIWHGESRLEGK